MAHILIRNSLPFILRVPRFLSLGSIIATVGKQFSHSSKQDAQAEAIANRFGGDRWSDAIEREISIRVR